jgi:hypothetical protein
MMKQRFAKYLRTEHQNISYAIEPKGLKRMLCNLGLAASNIRTISTPARRFASLFVDHTNPSVTYDCFSFVHEMNSVPITDKLDERKWDFLPINDPNSLKPGDAILITNKRMKIVHYALYLQNGLYLSKFGPSKLIVADRHNLSLGFEGTNACQIVPKIQ